MTIDRLIPTSGTGVTGTDFAAAIQEEITGLWGNSVITLADVAGTGDAITASASPALTDGLAAGMNFWLEAAADNTGPATIAIGDEDPVDLVDDDGLALSAGLLKDGRLFLLAFDGTAMRVFGSSGQKRIADYQVFTADGTWNKPAGTPDDALVIVEVVGGGAGGGSNNYSGGGGGGECKPVTFRAGDVPASVPVTIAAAVAARVAGNSSSFGSLVTAFGGGYGGNATSAGPSVYQGGGGGGGGPFATGGNGGNGNSGSSAPGAGGTADVSAGNGGSGATAGGNGYYGGGGGGSGQNGNGGKSVYGGGGGAGTGGSGGISIYGGAGGAPGANGQAPGGGGGANGGGGARGEIRVRTIG